MNDYDLFNIIQASSPEQREQILEEIQNKPIGEEYYCHSYSYQRDGECGIRAEFFFVRGINEEVFDIIKAVQKYPNTVQEVWIEQNCWLFSHRVYYNDYWEEIWTIDDAIEDIGVCGFYPGMLELEVYRKEYDNDDKLLSEKTEIVPFPIERMSDNQRGEYEKWKEDPVKWEEERKRKEEKEKKEREIYFEEFNKRFKTTDDNDSLPF